MRARLAILAANLEVELREVVLRDKPAAFIAVSPSATVPCLVTDACVIDESLDIMIWALEQSDPHLWLEMPQTGYDWIARCDGQFKHALDRSKYANRYPDESATEHHTKAAAFLEDLDAVLSPWVFERPTLADHAIMPFVRQFAFIDKAWFDTQPWPNLQNWLDKLLTSEDFAAVMHKYSQWHPDSPTVYFPDGLK